MLLRHCVDVGHPIAPSQFDDINRRASERSGEMKLMVALLEESIASLLGRAIAPASQRPTHQQEALLWVLGREPSLLPFDDVCHVLSIDPDRLRARLLGRLAQLRRGAQPPPALPRRQYGPRRPTANVAFGQSSMPVNS